MTLAVVAVFLAVALPCANGHALLLDPPSRNYVACKQCLGGVDCDPNPPACHPDNQPKCKEYNSVSLQAGGPDLTYKRGGGKWPSPFYSHGLCGDPVQGREKLAEKGLKAEPYLIPTPPQATYTAGQSVKFKIGISTEHYGFYVFRICDKVIDRETLKSNQEGEDCFKKWVLKRKPGSSGQPIDEKHPERWYVLGSGGGFQGFSVNASEQVRVAGADWDDSMYEPLIGANSNCGAGGAWTTDEFMIPEDLKCEHCTLQWWWVSGNRCIYDNDFSDYFSRNGIAPGGNKQSPVCGGSDGSKHGEEFWNCADITVKPRDSTPKPEPNRRRSNPKPEPNRRRRSTRRRRRRRSVRRRSSRRRSSRRRSSRRRRR